MGHHPDPYLVGVPMNDAQSTEVRYIPVQPLSEMVDHWIRLGLIDPSAKSLVTFATKESGNDNG